MNKGVTVFLNGIGYHFDDFEELVEVLFMNCDNNVTGYMQDAVVFDED